MKSIKTTAKNAGLPREIKRKSILLTMIAWTIILMGLVPCFVVASPAQLDRIVVVVNQGVITKGELDKKISMIQRQLKGSAEVPKLAVLRQQVLDSLIDNLLQLQLAKRAGIQVDEKELDGIIANIAKEHNLTLAQLKQTVVERDGISFFDFRKQIREQVIISRVQQQFLGKDITVSDKEIEAILRNPPKMEETGVPVQYHAIDILLEMADDASAEQKKLAANVMNKMAIKLRRDQSAEEVVKEGQQNLNEGMIIQNNDLGWRKVDEMPDLFGKEIAKMEVNQVIGPLKAPNGLHLIKLLGINGGGAAVKTFKITKEQARNMVQHRKLLEKLKPWLKEQRDGAYIKISE